MDLLKNIGQALNNQVPYNTGCCNLSASQVFSSLDRAVTDNKGFARVSISPDLNLYIYRSPAAEVYDLSVQTPVLSEARGIVLSSAGVRARPLPMFLSGSHDDPPPISEDQLLQVEHSVKIDGTMFFGLVLSDGNPQFLSKSGSILDLKHSGAECLVRDCYVFGLTPVFELVLNHSTSGVLVERPGVYLVGLRSISSGRLLPYHYLVKLAAKYDLHSVPILSSELDISSFLYSSNVEGIVSLYTNTEGSQFLQKRKSRLYYQLSPITSFVRYGAQLSRFLECISSESFDINVVSLHLTTREKTFIDEVRKLKFTEFGSDVLRRKIQKIRRDILMPR